MAPEASGRHTLFILRIILRIFFLYYTGKMAGNQLSYLLCFKIKDQDLTMG